MLKRLCMTLGRAACHRLISALWVGNTMFVVTLALIAAVEVLLIWFVWRTLSTATATREPLQPKELVTPRTQLPATANLDVSPS